MSIDFVTPQRSRSPRVAESLVDLLCIRAETQSSKPAYVFLDDGEREGGRVTYGDLDRRARSIAASLGAAGERALLLYPPGLDYIEAFFGCLYAGVVAVPAYPPSGRHLQRLEVIFRDAKPAVILTTEALRERFYRAGGSLSAMPCRWVATDRIATADAQFRRDYAPSSGQLAFLQYTSGSTAEPRGVMVTHGNLLSNQALIEESFAHDENCDLVGWLPLYHDMGLIGNILQPLYIGSTAYLMSPMAFLEKPSRWLRAISTYRAHTSGGPNFAFDLCVRKIRDDEKRELDLSRWRVAFSGAEPVRASTLERFATAFEGCGFQRDSFKPCYGLAEATLVVTAPTRGGSLPVVDLDRHALEQRRVVLTCDTQSVAAVGCGRARRGYSVRIVNPETAEPSAPDEIGEIWVAGPSVAAGYWNRPEDTAHAFGAMIPGDARRTYLRTGDLGFLLDGDVFIVGRLKDAIIIAGRNLYPHDIEGALDDQITGLRRGCSVVFSVTMDDREELVIVAEPDRSYLGALRREGGDVLLRRIRTCVANETGVEPNDIVLVDPGSVPKTSSGKLRRAECKRSYLSGELPSIELVSRAGSDTASEPSGSTPSDILLRDALSYLDVPQKVAVLTNFLISTIARVTKTSTRDLQATTSLSRSGLSSLRAVEVKHALDNVLGVETPIGVLLSDSSIGEVAETLARCAANDQSNSRASGSPPLSHAQKAMWTVHQIDASSNAYNLHLALDMVGSIDLAAFRDAIIQIVSRHAQLRTLYRSEPEGPRQELLDPNEMEEWIKLEDATNWSATELADRLTDEARRPFDLELDAPFRVLICRRGEQDSFVLFVAHHIAVDLWSLLLVISELDAAYSARTRESDAIPAATADYANFIQREADYLASPAAEDDWVYWARELSNLPPLLELPTNFPRPPIPDYRGASTLLQLGPSTTKKAKELARREGVSLFSVLLTVYYVLLQRITGQSDIIIGAPTSGRMSADTVGLIGNCVNPVALRAQVRPELTFRALLRRTHEQVRRALEHQRLPFPVIVDRLLPERVDDQWPIYQTWFVLQQAQSSVVDNLAALALGEDGAPFPFCGCAARSTALRQRVQMFDLAVMAAEVEEELLISFQYKTQLFAAPTIDRMAHSYSLLLDGVIGDPSRSVGELPRSSDAEQRRLLLEWNNTDANYSRDACLHELFSAQARRTPNSTAVLFGDEALTYGELQRRVNQLARRLVKIGVGPEAIVGLCLERSIEMVVGVLGVLTAGGAYLPLDPDHPAARLAHMIADARPLLILTQERLSDRIPIDAPTLRLDADRDVYATESAEPLGRRAGPQNLAYILYTSGSTGRPKGVAVCHRGVVNRIEWMQRRYNLLSHDTVLQKTPFGFDVSAWEFFWPLQTGARLAIAAPDDHREPAQIAELIERYGVTTLHFVPSMLQAFSNLVDISKLASLRRVICSGEELPATVARAFLAASHAELHNLYGPTEASIDVSAYQCLRAVDDERTAIGQPISNVRLYLLDNASELVSIGDAGELHIGGIALARGYVGQPDLTAERFIPDPFVSGERLYRTGDLARWRDDGNLEFLGRIDQQVKMRGFRVELGEIEIALRRLPTVSEAVVEARPGASGDKRLIAYLTGPAEFDHAAMKSALRRELPDYMIPQMFMWLDSLPVTNSGKLDRKALPDPDIAVAARIHVAPRNPTENALCEIFAEVLGLVQIGVTDDFFELGGDSIRAIQVTSRLRRIGYRVTPRQLFHHPTVERLVRELQMEDTSAPLDIGADVARSSEPFALAELQPIERDRITRQNRDIEDIYPLTPMQEGMLFHALSQSGTGLYHMQERYEIKGDLDVPAFEAAWRRVVERHPNLRTSFDWNVASRAHQIVHRSASLPVDFIDLRELSSAVQAAKINGLLKSEREKGFDLSQAPLMRITIIRVAVDRHICVRSFHHIIMDDWCTSPLLLDVRRHYAAATKGEAVDAEPAGKFKDYIAWLRARDQSAAESYWRKYLDDFSEPTPLVGAKSRERASDAAVEVDDVIVTLPREDYLRLESLVQRHHLTINTYVQGALALLLGLYAGVDDVVFGVTVAGRPVDLPAAESTLGLFINGLPLRVRIRPERAIVDWLRELMFDNLEMRQHEHVSQTMIQSWSSISRADALLFQHLLTFENAPIDASLRGDKEILDIDLLELRVHTNYPLTFVAIPGDTLTLRLTYDRTLFDVPSVEGLAEHFKRALEELISKSDCRVGDVQILSPIEQRRLALDGNETDYDYDEPVDLVRRFEMQVAMRPDCIAATCRGRTMTYRTLNERADQIATTLIDAGVGLDDLVGVWDTRGLEFLASMLGVFKAGAGYLPIDPAYPDGRIIQVLEEAEIKWLLVGAEHRSRAVALSASAEGVNPCIIDMSECTGAHAKPQLRHGPSNLAFVIFTSGSTGKPKGAMIEHRGMFNNLITKQRVLELTIDDVIAQTASQCFDISVWQFLTPIAIGARVEILPDEISRDPQRLLEELDHRNVTILEAVPSMIRALLDAAEDDRQLTSIRWLLPCGEAFTPELCRRFMTRFSHIRLLNAYGPAECSDDVTYHPIASKPEGSALSVPIGRPVDNTRVYVLNHRLDLTPMNVPGEICVGGVQVGRGYLHRSDLTAQAFVPDPFGPPGSILYRTGDLGYRGPDGTIEFLGRVDHQIKIRGHRVEPGEVEACLAQHPEVEASCVVACEISPRVFGLVAYVVAPRSDAQGLREHVLRALPEFMAPGLFIFMEALPLTPNGKVDRKKLQPIDESIRASRPYIGPRNATEEILTEIWSDVLGLDRIGVEDNFFELGGHSLLAIRLRSRIRSAFAIEIPLQTLFSATTIAALAVQIEALILADIELLSDEEASRRLDEITAART